MMRVVLAFVLAFTFSTTGLTEEAAQKPAKRITFDPGGVIIEFIDRYTEWRLNDDKVIVDGMCISACTLITALIPDKNVCITPYASLAFHSATSGGKYHQEATRLMWRMYPQWVRNMLWKRNLDGPLEHPELVYVDKDGLGQVYRECSSDELDAPSVNIRSMDPGYKFKGAE